MTWHRVTRQEAGFFFEYSAGTDRILPTMEDMSTLFKFHPVSEERISQEPRTVPRSSWN